MLCRKLRVTDVPADQLECLANRLLFGLFRNNALFSNLSLQMHDIFLPITRYIRESTYIPEHGLCVTIPKSSNLGAIDVACAPCLDAGMANLLTEWASIIMHCRVTLSVKDD